MTEAAPQVLNTTVYDSDDVVSVINTVSKLCRSSKSWDHYKIRYLIKPTGWKDKKWAKLQSAWNSSELEVALLRPDKFEVLDALACSGDSTAHPHVVKDLADAVLNLCYERKLKLDYDTLQIRLHEEVDSSAKLKSSHRNLEKRFTVKTRTLAVKRAELVRMKIEIAGLEAAIPEEQRTLEKMRERLMESTARMKAAGLL